MNASPRTTRYFGTDKLEIAAALADRSVEPKIGDPGRQRGNGKKNDMYAFLNVGLFYYFGSIRCPGLAR